MTQPAKSQEPSMEEILASIRRIIADDDASKSGPSAAPPPPPAAEAQSLPHPSPLPEVTPPVAAAPVESEAGEGAGAYVADQSSDILELTESMAAPMAESSAAIPPASVPDLGPQFRTIDGNSDVGFDEATEKPAAPSHGYGGARGQLVSDATSSAVDSAFNALAQTVLVQNARTLEDLVREMLRPMLKTWLDDNLPGMVERLVRAEIERVSRGR
jgi:cell pole-organizing protein PopZ